MGKVGWRLIAIVAVLLMFGSVGVYPILANRYGVHSPGWLMDKQLKLGLDLKGGVHLVLRVETEVALKTATDQEMERLREELATRGIRVDRIKALDSTRFQVEGVRPEQNAAFVLAATQAQTDFERSSPSNGVHTFAMKPHVQVDLRADAVAKSRETIERRVNELGVTESNIAQQGDAGDRILVQLPGTTDVERAKDVLRSTGRLELKIVERGPSTDRAALLVNDQVPDGMEVVPGTDGTVEDASAAAYYLVRRVPAVTGGDIRNARPSVDDNNQPAVGFTLTAEGGRRFGKATSENIGRQLAIVLDGRVRSIARIDGRITTDGRIFGSFSPDDVQNLSLLLRSGALPVPLDYVAQQQVGASLGSDSIRHGVTASLVGLLLVVAFMLTYYKRSGVNAVIALAINLVLLLGLLAYVGAVMTLPGIAGFVLTIGIGVDSNVLIFERIKEEIEANRGVRAAIHAGFSRVFLTLLDTHIAALISAAFLFQFGTGPIRGFAVTLFIGLLSNLFTSTFVSRTLFEAVLVRRDPGKTTLSI